MKVNAVLIVGIICAVVAVAVFAVVAFQTTFPIFQSSPDSGHFVSVSQNVGAEDSRFLWNSDSLALIAQAFALFAAAAATLGLLRTDEETTPE
jgi:amino acid permease